MAEREFIIESVQHLVLNIELLKHHDRITRWYAKLSNSGKNVSLISFQTDCFLTEIAGDFINPDLPIFSKNLMKHVMPAL